MNWWEDEPEPYDDDDFESNEEYEYSAWDDEQGMSYKESSMNSLLALMGQASGNSFILMMEEPHYAVHQETNFSLHPRFSQPCYGGELRKYESSHPHECTQPKNHRPGDLYHPFPEGIPAALGLPYWQFAKKWTYIDPKTRKVISTSRLSDATDQFFHDFFQNDNPWVKGFGGAENVLFYDYEVPDGGGQKRIGGVILKTCKIDSTVTVQMNWFIRYVVQGWIKGYEECLSNGLSKIEAYAFLMNNLGNTTTLQGTFAYHFAVSFSAKRFFEQKPNDLTGGTLEDRYDYNRTNIQDLWCNNFYEGDPVSFIDLLAEELKTEKNIMKAGQTVLHKMADKEGPIKEIPWRVEMTGGQTKPTIHKYKVQIIEPKIEVEVAA